MVPWMEFNIDTINDGILLGKIYAYKRVSDIFQLYHGHKVCLQESEWYISAISWP